MNTKNMHQKKCLNCSNQLEGNYCPQCGQKASTTKLKMVPFLKTITSIVLEADNRVWRTLHQIIINPGIVACEYVEGARVKYLNPLNIYFIIIASFFTISYSLGYSSETAENIEIQLDSLIKSNSFLPKQISELIITTNSIVVEWIKEIAIASKPLSAFFLFLLYKQSNRNYIETLIFTLYLGAQNFFLITAILIFESLTNIIIFDGIGLLIWAFYYFIGSKYFFKISWAKTSMLALPAFILDWLSLYILAFSLGHIKTLGYF